MSQDLFATIHWDENNQPISTSFNDVYFSKESGLDETRYVFLEKNAIHQRIQSLKKNQVFTIGETGFGSGLNFLCAWKTWEDTPKASGTCLHFISVEKFPLRKPDLCKALKLWPELKHLSQQLIEQYPPINARGFHRLQLAPDVSLTLIYENAEEALHQILPFGNMGLSIQSLKANWSTEQPYDGYIDAWFLDGFAPAKNPGMWTDELFTIIARLSKKGVTTFSTFTSAGAVRRGLEKVGFLTNKPKGFGTKREMLCGVFNNPLPPSALTTQDKTKPDPSWHLTIHNKKHHTNKELTIIGGGLAGCQTAFSAAEKGYKVMLFDKGQLASQASGNPLGVLYSKLSSTDGAFSEFNLAAYLFACRFYQSKGFFQHLGDKCGVIQVAESQDQVKKYRSIAQQYNQSSELVRWLMACEASEVSGVQLEYGGLWFPQAGWLNPPKLCQALCDHPNITVIEQQQIDRLHYQNKIWHLTDDKEQIIHTSSTVVIACATSAKDFEQCRTLPTQSIRGQISFVEASSKSQKLDTVLCGTGYIAPAIENHHCLGASFNLKSNQEAMDTRDHDANLGHAYTLSSSLHDLTIAPLESGRVSFRCTTPDYLPIVGAVANEDLMLKKFSAYRTNSKAVVDTPGEYWPSLYLNIGHGSKGLAYTPLAAELLLNTITGHPQPLPRRLSLHLHPARFLMRDLARNRL